MPFPKRLLFVLPLIAMASAATGPDWQPVRPLMSKYCYDCHGGKKTKGGIDLKMLENDPSVPGNFELWEKVRDAIENEDMPPEDDPQPAKEEKELLMNWLGGSLEAAASANAGDPGIVTIRRLTNAEYDRTIKDLTGVDFGLSKDFLPDGGGGEGFSNVGDVLFVSPQQVDKYLSAARTLTEHATILPGTGISFRKERVGPRSPIQFRTDAEQSLYVWYQKMAAPHLPKDDEDRREAEYMTAAWKYKHRDKTGANSLDQLAKDAKLSPAFLQNWWNFLHAEKPASRFLDAIREPWKSLPGPAADKPKEVPGEVASRIKKIQDDHRMWNLPDGSEGWVRTQRRQQDTDALRPSAIRVSFQEGQPLHLVAGDMGDGNKGDLVIFESITIEREGGKKDLYPDWLKRRIEHNEKLIQEIEANPEADKAPVVRMKEWNEKGRAALALFGRHPLGSEIDPKAIAIQPPAVVTLPFGEKSKVHVRARMDINHPEIDLGSIQWTITGSTPPDPSKMIPGPLIIYKRQTQTSGRVMYEFNGMKSVFPDEYNRLLEEVSRNYRRPNGAGPGVYFLSDEQLRATLNESGRWYLDRMLKDWRLLSPKEPAPDVRAEMDQSILGHLHWFAGRAWRRPVTEKDTDAMAATYYAARSRELDRESAGREVLMKILIAPDFVFKLEKAEQPGEHAVTPHELAARLSYFLWASVPDTELRTAADNKTILKPAVLEKQVRRMLKDPRAGSLAEEFAGQWLKFHNFSKHSTVDPGKFPEFTPELRADMHREAREFFQHLVREDRPVMEILLADYTFLNERLARHYSIPGITGNDEFRKVKVSDHHRGGVLGMGSILTKTSFPQRNSPVLRGDWLLHAVLGTPTPPPPADVPPFPEASDQPMTVRQRLEVHRADKACSTCHDKIDPLGFALESFDAIGRFRDKDETGLPIDNTGSLKDGSSFTGIDGLRSYLASHDRQFQELVSRKLVGYSLGRSIIASDGTLIGKMADSMEKSEGRLSAAVITLVQSRQFLNRRNE